MRRLRIGALEFPVRDVQAYYVDVRRKPAQQLRKPFYAVVAVVFAADERIFEDDAPSRARKVIFRRVHNGGYVIFPVDGHKPASRFVERRMQADG